MILNDRKIRILEAIINDYIQTAEPIGSRTIAKKYDLGISSATIRNEMSDLEEMGFIIQPHASSGRVPSDKGYRLYVDRLMQRRELTDEEMLLLQKMIAGSIHQIDYIMRETASAIAILTKCATIVSEPQIKKTRIRHIQFVPVDEKSFVMVLVTDGKAVKNRLIYLNQTLDEDTMIRLSKLLSENLRGCCFEDIDVSMAHEFAEQFRMPEDLLLAVLNAASDVIHTEDDVQIYTSGVKNILSFPEFSDVEKAKNMFQALEEKDMLITLLGSGNSEKIQVVIGAENNMELLEDCSVIKANYRVGSQNFGSIGVIGPKRMDYSQAVSVLSGILKHINAVIKALSGG
ncbi:MAG: heat-inducible transcriptional repressor HrcA [Clostridiales bacterium]|jgi:heat-inducible transcriptional repressor|nr:heat-inducible transcriptional repressor HrcA [Clostridiales bacterium]